MSNLLAEGLAWLTQKMQDHASTVVTYRRGPDSVAWHATIGRLLLRVNDNRGVRTQLTDRDFIGPADELASLLPPREGDTIDVAMGSVTKRFTLRPFGDEPCWRYADEQGETSIRVHTKQTGTV
jgi:hypothetical protein